MDPVTEEDYFRDSEVDWRHFIVRNTRTFISSSCGPFTASPSSCGSSCTFASLHRFTQCLRCIIARFPSISSHSLSIRLKPEQNIHTSNIWMLQVVQRSIGVGLSAFNLGHITTLWLCDRLVVHPGHGPTVWERHLHDMIEWVWRCIGRRWSHKIGGVLGGGLFGVGRVGGRRDGSWDSIYWLTCNWGNVESLAQQSLPWNERWKPGCEWWAVDPRKMQHLVNAVLAVYCTWCMLNSVFTHDYHLVK